METQKIYSASKLTVISLVIITLAGFAFAAAMNIHASAGASAENSGRINFTDEQAKKAGLQPRSGDDIVAKTLTGVYAITSFIAVLVIVIAGIAIITADGDSAKVATARKAIIYAVVGLAIIGSAFIITGIIQAIGTR